MVFRVRKEGGIRLDKIKTYIPDLDNILGGGIPAKSVVLVSGSAGTGKTTLVLEFLFGGSINDGETTILFTLNEHEVKLVESFKQFSFFKESLIKNSKMVIIDIRASMPTKSKRKNFFTSEEVLSFIYEQLDEYKPKRIVIDSISSICKRLDDSENVRKFLFDLGNMLMIKNCTAILISEVEPGQRKYSNFGVEEFICDGIIYLSHLEKGNRLRKTLQVVKMRGSSHSEEQFLLNITSDGIKLLKLVDN